MRKLEKLRREKRITQKSLAEKVGISQPYMHDIEKGYRKGSIDTIQKIANILECKVADIWE